MSHKQLTKAEIRKLTPIEVAILNDLVEARELNRGKQYCFVRSYRGLNDSRLSKRYLAVRSLIQKGYVQFIDAERYNIISFYFTTEYRFLEKI
jgi:hypothetical protein